MQNLWWAAGYNPISVPLAAGVLAPIGFVMPMSLCALAPDVRLHDRGRLNAELLQRLDLRPEAIVPDKVGRAVTPLADTATATRR
jgi:hypothetical protein